MSHSAVVRPTYQNSSAFESAIVDDDDDDDAEEEMFEDFVPSSLSDLLTPQELQRRGSRSSMSRPSVSFAQLKENVVWEGPPVGAEEGEEDDDEEEDTQFKMDEDQEFLGRTSVAVDIGSLKIS